MKLLVLLLLVLAGCGWNGDQRVTLSGESYAYVIVRLEFIQQVKDLCVDSTLKADYVTDDLYRKAVADCTFHQLSVINIDPAKVSDFQSKYCQPGADLSGFTPQQISDITAACLAIRG